MDIVFPSARRWGVHRSNPYYPPLAASPPTQAIDCNLTFGIINMGRSTTADDERQRHYPASILAHPRLQSPCHPLSPRRRPAYRSPPQPGGAYVQSSHRRRRGPIARQSARDSAARSPRPRLVLVARSSLLATSPSRRCCRGRMNRRAALFYSRLETPMNPVPGRVQKSTPGCPK
jgi:hypothetical protein